MKLPSQSVLQSCGQLVSVSPASHLPLGQALLVLPWQVKLLQTLPPVQLPQEPPQPSSPHCLSAQFLVQVPPQTTSKSLQQSLYSAQLASQLQGAPSVKVPQRPTQESGAA